MELFLYGLLAGIFIGILIALVLIKRIKQKIVVKTEQNPKINDVNVKKIKDIEDITVFEKWLMAQYKSNGEKYALSTINYYITQIKEVLKLEGDITLKYLAENIDSILILYGKGGVKERPYEKEHGSTIAGLKKFKEFIEEY